MPFAGAPRREVKSSESIAEAARVSNTFIYFMIGLSDKNSEDNKMVRNKITAAGGPITVAKCQERLETVQDSNAIRS